jgi:hypothetical protein
MSDWRDQFTEPRCGFVQVVDIGRRGQIKVRCWRYLSDFGYVNIDRPPEWQPEPNDEKEIRAFAKAKWDAGEDGPFMWGAVR